MISQEIVLRHLTYSEGKLYWKLSTSNRVKVDDRFGSIRKDGRFHGQLFGKTYFEHRLIYLYHKSHLPEYVDHIDGNPFNNKIENLRECSLVENQHNRKSQKSSSSKYKGVHWCKSRKKWCAKIKTRDRHINLGRFATENEASKAYNTFARDYQKEFYKQGN